MRSYVTAIAGAAMAVLLSACAAPGEWRDSVRESIDATMQEGRKTASKPVPAAVSEALLPPIEIKLPDGKVAPVEPRFDLTLSNAPAREVFMGLVEGTPYSMVVHPDVKGLLSLNLKEVTVPEALEAIRQVYGYEYRRDGNRFLILGAEMQTRIFTVNYLNVVRSGTSSVNIGGGGLGGAGSGTGTTTTAGAAGTTGSSSVGGSGAVQVSTTSQSDFWRNLTSTLTTLVGTEGGRKVIVNPQTGLVVVRAMPEELRIVEDYLGVTHASINRQVVLEAKVVEVELKNEFQSGVNWSLVSTNYRGQVFNSSASIFGGGTTGGGSGTRTSDFGGIFSLLLQTGDFSLLIDALRGQGEVQILSSPRVSTVNNQKAVIKVGGEEFFVTGVTGGSTTSGTTTTTTTPSITLSSFFSGISLDVTPQIDEANNIVLHIHPSVSAVSEKTKSLTVSGESFQLPLALSTIQESDNIVRTQSGQIIVIGGLMKEATTDRDASVPLLADVPIVGSLFKHKNISRIKKELVILLKPTSINLGQDWNDAVGEAQERIKRIRAGS